MIAFLASIGAAFLTFLAAAGRLVRFAGQALAAGLTPPYYPRLILRQIVYIGYFSLPVVGLTAIFTGMVLALQSYTGFSRFAAEGAVATVVVLSMTRELGPVIASLMVAGRVGAAIAAEIGTMRVTDLPLPEPPMTTTDSPTPTSRSMPRSTGFSPNDLWRPRTAIFGGVVISRRTPR